MTKQVPTTKRVTYTMSEVARMTGRSRSTVHRWVQSGVLQRVNIPGGRQLVSAASLEKLTRVDRLGGTG